MKNDTKRWLASVLAVVIVGGMCYLSFDYRLTASEGDGSSTAVEQQQAVEAAAKPVEVIVPAKPAAEATEKASEKEAEKTTAIEAEAPDTETPENRSEAEETVSKETVAEETIPEETAVAIDTEIPAPTSAPIVSEAPVETQAPAKLESPAETQAPAPEISVKVRLNNRNQLYFGDRAELEAIVEGAEVYTVRWQYNDGRGWQDIIGKTGNKYRFTLDEENAKYEYRALVIGA